MLVFILATIKLNLKAKDTDIAIIGIDAYCAACYLKKAQVFTIFIRNIQYQAKKKAKAKTNPKTVVSQKYHDFFDIFTKKNLDTFLLY